MEAIAKPFAKPFFQVPQGVNHAVNRTKNIISCCWNIKRQSADTAKLRKQAFSCGQAEDRAADRASVAVGRSWPEKMESMREKAEH
ncbi:MAG: hypothetical protein DME65_02925 [Verrucomicrobia bacterium]|nr:MAG: hypothetical protein DME65_02925 [Verrucomicrobiota bacterium]